MQNQFFPDYVAKYFWGDNLSELSMQEHADYISQTILDKGDIDAISWLFSHINKDVIRDKLSEYKLTPQSANFWSVYLS